MKEAGSHGNSGFAALRGLMRKSPAVERCDLCSAEITETHSHLIEPATRRLFCSCDPCAILFGGDYGSRYRRVYPRSELLRNFELSDSQWENLGIPINMTFFYRSSAAGRVVAVYPSPAGATESLLPLAEWTTLEDANPFLKALEADVEALLINRIGSARDYFRVSIDECFQLVGLIRLRWRGFSGGDEVWEEIGNFFDRLKTKAALEGTANHA